MGLWYFFWKFDSEMNRLTRMLATRDSRVMVSVILFYFCLVGFCCVCFLKDGVKSVMERLKIMKGDKQMNK